jgi:hypothetical protein
MAQVTDTVLKTYFQTGDIPTEGNYVDLIDSKANLGSTNQGDFKITGNYSGSSLIISGAGDQPGSITASGDISASGYIKTKNIQIGYGGGIYLTDSDGNTNDTALINVADVFVYMGDADSPLTMFGSTFTVDTAGAIDLDSDTGLWYFKDGGSAKFTLNAQGGKFGTNSAGMELNSNLSMSIKVGYTEAADYVLNRLDFRTGAAHAQPKISFGVAKGDITASGELHVGENLSVSSDSATKGNITASGAIKSVGDISASAGDMYANALTLNVGANTATATLQPHMFSFANSGEVTTWVAGISGVDSGQPYITSQGAFTFLLDSNNGDTNSFFNIKRDAALPNSGTELFKIDNAGVLTNLSHITSSGGVKAVATSSFEMLQTTTFVGSRPIRSITGDTTLSLPYAGTYNRCGAHTVKIPTNANIAFPIGTEIEFIQTAASGHLMITSQSAAVTVNSRFSLYSASGQFSAISIKKVGTNEWDILGDLTA